MKYLSIILCLFLTGCFAAPERKIFQTEIPKPVEKKMGQIDAEKSAAYIIKSAVLTDFTHLAEELSASLGVPRVLPAVDSKTAENVALKLSKYRIDFGQDSDAVNKFLSFHAGEKIEGTGFNLYEPLKWFGNLTPFIFIGLLFMFPTLIPLVIAWGKKWKDATVQIVKGIENHVRENSESKVKDSVYDATTHKTDSLIDGITQKLA